MAPALLTPGANVSLSGARASVRITARELGGVLLIVEDGGPARAAAPAEAGLVTRWHGDDAVVEIDLAAVAAGTDRLRLLAWTARPTRLLEPVEAEVNVDGGPVARVAIAAGAMFRAAELLELYRRHGAWKLRAVASGWSAGPAAMAQAVGIPDAAVVAATRVPGDARGPSGGDAGSAGASPGARGGSARAGSGARGARSSPGPAGSTSTAVGPPGLRPLVDAIVGPGPRGGDADHLAFPLGGVEGVMVAVQSSPEGMATVSAVVPLGPGAQRERLAEAALRASGEAPLGRIAFANGSFYACASTAVDEPALDTAVIKSLLAEAWSTAVSFAEGAGPGAGFVALPPRPPRELRLGIMEDLGEPAVWAEAREMLLESEFMPLADAPQACLAPTDGTLWLGPVALGATPRAWSVICERVLVADARLNPAAWEQLAALNTLSGSLRLGVLEEPGGGITIVLNYNALQVQRGQPRRDLEAGLGLVDDQAEQLGPQLLALVAGRKDRGDLAWPAARSWNGPGREIEHDPLAHELAAPGAPPADLLGRVKARRAGLGRGGMGYLAHLALGQAEAGGPEAWGVLAARLVALAPSTSDADRTTLASVQLRLARLQHGPAARAPGDRTVPKQRRRRWF